MVAVMVVAGWAPRLFWGLWLDETFVVWQAAGGWSEIASAKLTNPGQSALFAYLEAAFYFPGSRHMELWLRLPAVAGAFISCFFLYRLAERLVGKGTGFVAAIAFLGNLSVLVYATQARPYTLALAACLAAMWGLARWLETGSRRDGLLFAVSFALVLYLHIMFIVFALVPTLFVIRRAQRGGAVNWRGLMRWLGVTAILLLPLVVLMRDFMNRSGGLSPFRLPSFSDLVVSSLPGSVLFSLVAFAALFVAARRQTTGALKDPAARPALELALVWLLVPPLIFFVGSHVIRQAVLADRYYLYTVAAQALIVAFLFRGFQPTLARTALLACFVPIAIMWGIQDGAVPDGPASWRRPLMAVRALDPAASAPVFVQAGHPLANSIDWQHAVEQRSFVYSQLDAYPLANHVYPMPYALDDAAKAYVGRAADTELAGAPLIFFTGTPAQPMARWVRQFFEARGYTSSFAVNEVLCLLVLRKPPQAAPSGD